MIVWCVCNNACSNTGMQDQLRCGLDSDVMQLGPSILYTGNGLLILAEDWFKWWNKIDEM